MKYSLIATLGYSKLLVKRTVQLIMLGYLNLFVGQWLEATSWIHSYFDNDMAKFMINDRTDI